MYNQLHENDRHCLECGLMLNGRADKKFCGDQCRASFHNREYTDTTGTVRDINRVLKRNRFLLKRIADQGKKSVFKKNLEEMGFNFKFHTHSDKTPEGTLLFFCYETGYQEESEKRLRVFLRTPT